MPYKPVAAQTESLYNNFKVCHGQPAGGAPRCWHGSVLRLMEVRCQNGHSNYQQKYFFILTWKTCSGLLWLLLEKVNYSFSYIMSALD